MRTRKVYDVCATIDGGVIALPLAVQYLFGCYYTGRIVVGALLFSTVFMDRCHSDGEKVAAGSLLTYLQF